MKEGMTLIVRNTAKIIIAFIVVFAIFIAASGHLSPGGGFPGGVLLAAGAALLVLAFGHERTREVLAQQRLHGCDAIGALAFLAVALAGFLGGMFFANFLPTGSVGDAASGGTIALSNLAIFLKVGAGLAGAFVALALYRGRTSTEDNS